MIEKITTEYPDFDDLKYKVNEIIDTIYNMQLAISNLDPDSEWYDGNHIDDISKKVDLTELAKKAEKECRFNPVQADREVYKALTSAENMSDKFAEQRKWLNKLCWFWNDACSDYIGILFTIHDLSELPFENDLGEKYQHCRPVKPDDEIIYKGE